MISFAQAIDFVYTIWRPVDPVSGSDDDDEVQDNLAFIKKIGKEIITRFKHRKEYLVMIVSPDPSKEYKKTLKEDE